LGHLIAHAPEASAKQLAEKLFRASLKNFETIGSLRTWTFAILGLHYLLREHGEDGAARVALTRLAERLNAAVAEHESPDWPWPEETVKYDNGRIPQALIVAGYMLGRREMTDRGLRILRWLVDVQRSPNGHASFIGNRGWLRHGGARARFDQQPLEAAAMIGACKAAHRASGEVGWLAEMRRCFEWYLGRNEKGATLIDFRIGGCYDGLTEEGVNRNQGAESLLSWLLSLLTMHEMQTGDVLTVG
jgi:hypothetical protein